MIFGAYCKWGFFFLSWSPFYNIMNISCMTPWMFLLPFHITFFLLQIPMFFKKFNHSDLLVNIANFDLLLSYLTSPLLVHFNICILDYLTLGFPFIGRWF
jgi:hypothetical protein